MKRTYPNYPEFEGFNTSDHLGGSHGAREAHVARVRESEDESEACLIQEVEIGVTKRSPGCIPTRRRVLDSSDIADYIYQQIGNHHREKFVFVGLSGDRRPIAYNVASTGLTARVLVEPRLYAEFAFATGSA